MSNTEKSNRNTEKILTRYNEEEPTVVEINEISNLGVNINNTQITVPENNECSNDDLNKNNVIQTLDIELKNVIVKSNELEEKCTVFQLVENDQKSRSIWVQYNQMYGKQTPHRQYDGGSGGAPLSYDPESRNYFVQLVFILLFAMLAITLAYGILVLNIEPLKDFYQQAGFILIIFSSVVLIGMNYVMACTACARVPPCNFICLVVVVIAMSNLVAAVTVRFKTSILVQALIATMITVALCVLLAYSRFDFTTWYIYVAVIAMVFMAISLVCSIAVLAMGMQFKPLQILLLFVGTLLQVVILIMELQMILGGKRIEIGEDDYALAAYLLYTSIVHIFLQIVQLMGLEND